MAIAPSTTTAPFLIALEPNVTLTSILTVGDALTGSTSGVFAGIPDGIGAFDNGDGTITVLVNHELTATAGVARDHGSIGSFIDRIVINKTTLAVVSGDDAIKTVNLWDDAADRYVVGTTAFSIELIDGITVFAEGQNLTDEPTRQYQGDRTDWFIQNERYGRTFWAGVSARF